LDRVAKLVGYISITQADMIVEFFYNLLVGKPSLAGIDYDFIDKNATRRKGNIEEKYSILLVGIDDVVIVETVYEADVSRIDNLVNKKYENFNKLYAEYSDRNHHLVLASFYINENVKDEARKNNVILLQRKNDLIETIMPNSQMQ